MKSSKKCNTVTLLLLSVIYTLNAAATLSDGYVLCGAYGAKKNVLLDNTGSIVYTWTHEATNGYSVYLLENGNLLRTAQVGSDVIYPDGAGPIQGIIEEVDPNGNVIWSYQLSDSIYCTHHDHKPLPNGNVIAVSFELKTKEEMIAVGVDTMLLAGGGWGGGGNHLLSEMIFELQPDRTGGGNHQIVWEWHMWDHIIPGDQAPAHPELFSGSMGSSFSGQWVHLNGIDYCPRRDLILFTSRLFSEVYIIDHSTTTAQAATHSGGNHGKGGDLLYRWGRPSNYCETQTRLDTTTDWRDNIVIDTVRYHPNDWVQVLHCCTFIPEGYPGGGNILFFHNNSNFGAGETSVISQVIELAPPVNADGTFITPAPGEPFGPMEPTWMYAPSDSFHSPAMSSALRMANGNTVVHEAYPSYGGTMSFSGSTNSRIREVTPAGEMIWSTYIDLSGTEEVDTSDTSSDTSSATAFNPPKIMYYPSDYPGITSLFNPIANRDRNGKRADFPLPQPRITCRGGSLFFRNVKGCRLNIFDLKGNVMKKMTAGSENVSLPVGGFATGTYLVQAVSARVAVTRRVTLIP